MNHETARSLLGIGSTASHSEIETAWRTLQDEILGQLRLARSSDERQVLTNKLDALQAACDLLQSASSTGSTARGAAAGAGLSHTKLADLPGGDAFDTASGTGGNRAQILSLKPGDRLSGRFEIQQQIGAGGMGVVYRALDTNRDEAIALKVMQPGLLSNDAAKQRFMSEAKIAIGLSHPHIVKTFDVQKDGAYLYLTMELLQGQSLREAMTQRKQAGREWALDEVIGIATSLCEALSYAHKLTIHRDLKPENVWLAKDGLTKLMDFGIAKLLSGSQLTQTSTVMGTAYYMAPEQLQGARDIDHRADQYAVAVMIYELLTGKVPTGRFKSVIELCDDVGAPLSGVIDRALASQPEERFDNMAVFAEQLRDALKRNVGKKPVNKTTDEGGSGKLIAGAVAVVLLAGGAVLYSKQTTAPNPAPAVAVVATVKQPEPAKVEVKPVEQPKVEVQKAKAEPEVVKPKVVEKPAEPVKAAPVKSSGPAMVRIPAGSIQIGSSKDTDNPVRMVSVQAFEIGKYAVTQKEWRDVMGNNPSKFNSCGDNCPVEQVSWDDIQIFLQKLNAKTGRQYRLPNETEWEYACYGGSQTEYCGGNDIDSVAWYGNNASPGGNSNQTTHPVGQKQANGYGLYDMSGNVWQWMENCYSSSCSGRALRGGSWNDRPQSVRAAYRSGNGPASRYYSVGFRVARTLP
jgi:formylglycine-generating enzyme required for sulfatase activity